MSEREMEKEARGVRTYTKILTLSDWFIFVGYALTPNMWDVQNETWWGPGALRRKGGKERKGLEEKRKGRMPVERPVKELS